jgi:hypothetical protein
VNLKFKKHNNKSNKEVEIAIIIARTEYKQQRMEDLNKHQSTFSKEGQNQASQLVPPGEGAGKARTKGRKDRDDEDDELVNVDYEDVAHGRAKGASRHREKAK